MGGAMGGNGDDGHLDVGWTHLAALLSSVDEVVAAFDDTGTIRFISRAAKSLLGYDPDQLVGRSVVDVMHPEDLEAFAMGWEPSLRKLGDQGQQPDRRVLHADGHWVEFAIDFHSGPD